MADKKIKCQAKNALYLKGKGMISSKKVLELSEQEFKALDSQFPNTLNVIAEKPKTEKKK